MSAGDEKKRSVSLEKRPGIIVKAVARIGTPKRACPSLGKLFLARSKQSLPVQDGQQQFPIALRLQSGVCIAHTDRSFKEIPNQDAALRKQISLTMPPASFMSAGISPLSIHPPTSLHRMRLKYSCRG